MRYTHQILALNGNEIDSILQVENNYHFRIGDKYHIATGDHSYEWKTITKLACNNNEWIAFFNRGEKFGGGDRILLKNIRKTPSNYIPRSIGITKDFIKQNYEIF